MTDQITPVPAAEFERTPGLGEWRVLSEGAAAHYRTRSFEESARFVRAIGERSAVAVHPPAVDIRAAGVTLRLLTTGAEYYGMSTLDVDAAREISANAREFGLVADPSVLQSVLIVPGAPRGTDIVPFWRALLGYEPRPDSPDEDLVDPQDRWPAFWFEQMNEPRPDGGGAIHVAVWVPIDRVEDRAAAVVAAGGRVVRDANAPSWWTFEDAAGNEADVASVAGRD